jgi:hypothetical protein
MRDLEKECWERYEATTDDASRREWIALVLKIRCAGPKGKGVDSTESRPGGRHAAAAGVLREINGGKAG